MSTLNNTLPKIETILKNENRLFDCSFYNTIDDAFEALQAFIVDSYSLNPDEQFSINYEDDENDFVTVSSIEDFKEAVEEANCKGEILKIHVILQKKNSVSQSTSESMNQKNIIDDDQKEGVSNESKSNEKSEENENQNKKGFYEILNDLRNDEAFREEVVSFVKEALLSFQENSSNPDYDISTCVLTALSSHERLMQHESFQSCIVNLLPLITAKVQPFSAFLMNIDANMVGVWINQMIERWIANSQPSTLPPFSHLMQNIFQNPCMNKSTINDITQSFFQSPTTDNEPAISSSIKNEYDMKQEHNGSSRLPFNIGSLLSMFQTPLDTNNNDSVMNDNSNVHANSDNNKQHNRHPFFFGPPWWNRNKRAHFHNYPSNENSNAESNNDNVKNINREPPSLDDDLKLCVIKDNDTLCDEAVVMSKQILIKTWRVKNIGKKEIENGLYVQYVGNAFNPMVNGVKFPIIIDRNALSVNEETDVCVTIESPIQNGHYSSEWKIFTADGKPFNLLLTININVSSDIELNESKSDTIHEINNKNDSNGFETLKNNKSEEKQKNVKEENVDPYAKQIQILLEMGFTNVDMLRNLLISHNGLVDDVINVLA